MIPQQKGGLCDVAQTALASVKQDVQEQEEGLSSSLQPRHFSAGLIFLHGKLY